VIRGAAAEVVTGKKNLAKMLKPIVEVERYAATSPEPHSIGLDRTRAYVASRATRKIDIIDRASWKKVGELDPPGMPWGMTFSGGALVMTCGETDEDYRRIRRYVPDEGWAKSFVGCPDDTGSHLALYGGRVLLGQWYNQKLLLIDHGGAVSRSYDTPHGVAGVAIVGEIAVVLGTDEEEHGEYYISRIDLSNGASEDIATVPFRGRGLAFDGSRFWSNHREADGVVVFTLPG
jgi:hypothetical protein